mgnify:CR=1 FL=1
MEHKGTRKRKRLLVKSQAVADAKKPTQPASKQALGELLKAEIDRAVLCGRLSGSAAAAGMRALGLIGDQ